MIFFRNVRLLFEDVEEFVDVKKLNLKFMKINSLRKNE